MEVSHITNTITAGLTVVMVIDGSLITPGITHKIKWYDRDQLSKDDDEAVTYVVVVMKRMMLIMFA